MPGSCSAGDSVILAHDVSGLLQFHRRVSCRGVDQFPGGLQLFFGTVVAVAEPGDDFVFPDGILLLHDRLEIEVGKKHPLGIGIPFENGKSGPDRFGNPVRTDLLQVGDDVRLPVLECELAECQMDGERLPPHHRGKRYDVRRPSGQNMFPLVIQIGRERGKQGAFQRKETPGGENGECRPACFPYPVVHLSLSMLFDPLPVPPVVLPVFRRNRFYQHTIFCARFQVFPGKIRRKSAVFFHLGLNPGCGVGECRSDVDPFRIAGSAHFEFDLSVRERLGETTSRSGMPSRSRR